MEGPLLFFTGFAIYIAVIWLIFKIAMWVSPDKGEGFAFWVFLISFVALFLFVLANGEGGGLDPEDFYRP